VTRNKRISRLSPRKTLAAAVLLGIGGPPAQGATIVVDEVACSLDDAIAAANSDSSVDGCTAGAGTDRLLVTAAEVSGINLTAITTDLTILGSNAAAPAQIDAANQGRVFVVGGEAGGITFAPSVSFANLIVRSGLAQGGSGADGGGGGAGLGGAMYIHSGTVVIDRVSFRGNSALGGDGSTIQTNSLSDPRGGGGGGGMSGNGGVAGNDTDGGPGSSPSFGEFLGGGGGGGGDHVVNVGSTNGGRGGFPTGGNGEVAGQTAAVEGGFGGGGGGGAGAVSIAGRGAAGGFGGGGGGGGGVPVSGSRTGGGGDGGFGGAGGAGGSGVSGEAGGRGGFGGGGGAGGYGEGGSPGGSAGFGGVSGTSMQSVPGQTILGSGGAGAGFGGAIAIRSGTLQLYNTSFVDNVAAGGASIPSAGLAKGGALFALDTLVPANANARGYPIALPTVTGCAVSFDTNGAANAAQSDTDNADTYGTSRAALMLPCEVFSDGFE
jgi:hypothetical protein